jgi:PIN domain nuclease of toxin-antitoxin system
MKYLLDTNAWLQLGQAPTQIPLRVRKILLAENTLALSPISIIEIAQKQTNGRECKEFCVSWLWLMDG